MIKRFEGNPIIAPKDVKPYYDGFDILSAINAGATVYQGKTILLVRVAERPIQEEGYVSSASLDLEAGNPGQLKTVRCRLDDPDLEYPDPRWFRHKGESYLTSISHLRVASSDDGRSFTISDVPALFPTEPYEAWGIEDPRITFINGAYYINYSAISGTGIVTCLAKTVDFRNFEKLGIIFSTDNKDIAIFPEKINDRFWCFHRPRSAIIAKPSMWLASSSNLLDWGDHHFLMGPRPGEWDEMSVGCGAYPIKTNRGWLQIYHGSTNSNDYCSGAVLLDLEKPWKIIARSDKPIHRAEAPYEISGNVSPGAIFHNGLVERGDGIVDIYYGATDDTVCVATMNVNEVLDSLIGK